MVQRFADDDSGNDRGRQHESKMAVLAYLSPDVLFGLFGRGHIRHGASLAAASRKIDCRIAASACLVAGLPEKRASISPSLVSYTCMAAENTFDIVSKVDLQEVHNAVQNALKEIHTRFDLKDSKSEINLEGKDAIILTSSDEYKLKAVNDILQSKLVKRGVPLKALTYGAVEPAAGSRARQKITMQQGIPTEKAKEIVRVIKDSKKRVQAAIQGDTVRVSGKDRDTLQEIIALLKARDFGIDMQFTNYRSN
jgi:cyclic-di-GMP-binding protein